MRHYVGEKVKLYWQGRIASGVIIECIKADFWRVNVDDGYTCCRYSLDLEGWL